MRNQLQSLCALCGLLLVIVMITGFWIAGFLPPLAPGASAEQIAQLYRANAGSIRIGVVLVLFTAAIYAPFITIVSMVMMKIQSKNARTLAYLQLVCGVCVVMFFVLPAISWTVAAYRPERAPELTQALNDFGWFFFVMPFQLPFVQTLALGSAILGERSQTPVFPRWFGYFNVWCALLYIPGGLVTFFKQGPFAWNGVLAFWLPAAVFCAWLAVMTVYLLQIINRETD